MPKFTKLLSTVIFLFIFLLHSQLYAQEGTTFQQQDDEFGLAVMEAENYTEQVPGADSYFEFVTEPALFSGTGAMQALPDAAVFADAADAIDIGRFGRAIDRARASGQRCRLYDNA